MNNNSHPSLVVILYMYPIHLPRDHLNGGIVVMYNTIRVSSFIEGVKADL